MKPCCTPARAAQAPAATKIVAPCSSVAASGKDMARLEGGEFWMGSEGPEAWAQDGEGPVRQVLVAPFRLDITTVTNAQFAAFVLFL